MGGKGKKQLGGDKMIDTTMTPEESMSVIFIGLLVFCGILWLVGRLMKEED